VRVFILPNARESQTVRALLDRGLIVTTMRTRRGGSRNVASVVPVLNVIYVPNWRKEK
jgi:hypothetical protein